MIELKAKSENYIPKEELEKAIAGLEKAKEEIDRVTAETELVNLLNEDFEVIIEVEESDIIAALTYANGTMDEDVTNAVVESLGDDYIEEEYNDRALAKPLLASDFNSYDFKRQMCDFFETGYHVDSFDLVKLFAEKLKVDYLLWKRQRLDGWRNRTHPLFFLK